MENKITLNRTEAPLSAITNVSAKYGANRTFWAKVQLIIGIPLCLVIIGIFMVKNALKKIRSATFDLILETRYSDFEGKPFTLGANAAVDALKKRSRLGSVIRSILGAIPIIGRLFRSKNSNEIPVSVQKDVAKEIINEVGAAILDLKAQA
jgi:TctA family transporter